MTASALIGFISAVLALARLLVGYAEQKKWMDAGAAKAVLKGICDADDAISRATKARQDMRSANARDPTSVLRDDDGFKRPD